MVLYACVMCVSCAIIFMLDNWRASKADINSEDVVIITFSQVCHNLGSGHHPEADPTAVRDLQRKAKGCVSFRDRVCFVLTVYTWHTISLSI